MGIGKLIAEYIYYDKQVKIEKVVGVGFRV